MDYPKLISEKWNLTAKFNCLQAIYFDAPSALRVAVPMCVVRMAYCYRKLPCAWHIVVKPMSTPLAYKQHCVLTTICHAHDKLC